MRENEYQAQLIQTIGIMMPDTLVLKNDPNYRQGILDLTVFRGAKYGMLEVKASEKSKERPNQRYYIDLINQRGGFARFIYPENEEEVLRELKLALQ